MRYSNGRPNNGYVGKNTELMDLQGVISNNKHYKNLASIDQFYAPTGWLSLPNIQPGEQKLAGLLAIYKGATGNTGATADSNFVGFICTLTNSGHSYFVDWGDGNTGRFGSGTRAQYQYNWENISSSTEMPEGYRQVVIQAYPAVGTTFTALDFNQRFTQTGITLPGTFSTPWLDMKLAGVCFNSITISGGTSRLRNLKRFEFIGSFPNITSLSFTQCVNLECVAGLSNLLNLSSASNLLSVTYSLKTAPWIDTRNVTNFTSFYDNSACVSYMQPYDFSKGVTFSAAFATCENLNFIPKFNISNGVVFASMFQNCFSLRTIPEMDFSKGRNFSSLFFNNVSLCEIPPINTNAGITFDSMFRNTERIIQLPSGLNTTNATNLSFFVARNWRLEEFPGLTTSNCTNFTQMFENTRMITLPKFDTSNGITFANMFNDAKFITLPEFDVGKGLCFGNGFAGSNAIMSAALLNTKSNISYADCTLSPTALDQIFTNLASVTGGQIITITNNWGSSGCNRSIATGKGWTVTG
jgi:hypothetical protein